VTGESDFAIGVSQSEPQNSELFHYANPPREHRRLSIRSPSSSSSTLPRQCLPLPGPLLASARPAPPQRSNKHREPASEALLSLEACYRDPIQLLAPHAQRSYKGPSSPGARQYPAKLRVYAANQRDTMTTAETRYPQAYLGTQKPMTPLRYSQNKVKNDLKPRRRMLGTTASPKMRQD